MGRPLLASSGRPLAVLMAALVAACGAGSPAAVPTPQATPQPTPSATAPPPTPLPPPPPTPPAANRAPEGSFRITPEPDANGVVVIDGGDAVHVNGAHFVDPDGDRLYLQVDWGDGDKAHVACGPCRLDHTYLRFGTHKMRATITDLIHTVALGVTVSVR